MSLTPTSVQASLGLQQCLVALKDLEVRVSARSRFGVSKFLTDWVVVLETVAGVLTVLRLVAWREIAV